MTVQWKSAVAPGHHIVLVDREPHPELFGPKGRRVFNGAQWSLEAGVLSGGHILRFEHRGLSAWELLTENPAATTSPAALASVPAVGDRDFEYRFERHGVVYMNSLQAESLSENIYESEMDEQIAQGRAAATNAIIHRYRDEAGMCLSMLEIQRFPKEVHVHAYHFLASGNHALRTQTLFELA